MDVKIEMPNGEVIEQSMVFGQLKRFPLGVNETAKLTITCQKGYEISDEEGSTDKLEGEARGGEVGLVLDTRGRPIALPEESDARRAKIIEWYSELDLYAEEYLNKLR